MELIDLMYRRDMRKGRVSPRVLIHSLQKVIESEGDIEALAYVMVDREGNIRVGWSETCAAQLIGLFTVAQQHVLDSMKE